MTDSAATGGETGEDRPILSADGIRTYLRCPRRYEFAHVHEFDGDEDDAAAATADRIDLLRRALCTALERVEIDDGGDSGSGTNDDAADALEDVALDRLATLWNEHDERFHSREQRRHERRVLEATVTAYVEAVGADHAAGVGQLLRTSDGSASADDLLGPDIRLSSDVTPDLDGTLDGGPDEVTVGVAVDYVYGDGSSVVGVRFVPTVRPLGLLRYRSDWERVAELFVDHFDPEAEAFEPGSVGALFETAVVLDGLRNLCDRLGLEDRTCRYVQIPLADRSGTSVNWVRGTVETDLEPVDLTDVYIDHLTYGRTHEHRNETVDNRLASVVGRIVAGGFDPSDRWEQVAEHACPDCAYTVCCGEYIAEEVRFDG
ncbi:hypothetical protein [Halopiger xanaduensis]|uniref:PD-(D/E)XK endonuclease-like domain-containing protein n=1 Tax=Halopiger xanaduensis (strain DSM 18323 / JCM 14033 / SH-6) TaxID=797210 RepID=F8DB48_HALXS|nr:hypothetical protein [Halopiger xanaduensis]AEH38414.1 hypothetical protein Halxa_3808 [Halopiger xanaduensis SH-6]